MVKVITIFSYLRFFKHEIETGQLSPSITRASAYLPILDIWRVCGCPGPPEKLFCQGLQLKWNTAAGSIPEPCLILVSESPSYLGFFFLLILMCLTATEEMHFL